MTIKEAIKTAVADWRSEDGGDGMAVTDVVLVEAIRNLAEEAIEEYLPSHDVDNDPISNEPDNGDRFW